MPATFSQADIVVQPLAQIRHHRRLQGNGGVGFAVAARHISPHTDQVAGLLKARPQLFELLGAAHVLDADHRGHDPADGRFNINGRVMALFGQSAGQHDMPVEHAPRRIGYRVLLVITFRQHRIKRGYRAAASLGITGALHQLGQLETAVGQQRQSLVWHQNNLDKARETWQQAYARVEGLRKLVQRYADEARQLEDKREQKLMDELSQRLPRKEVY